MNKLQLIEAIFGSEFTPLVKVYNEFEYYMAVPKGNMTMVYSHEVSNWMKKAKDNNAFFALHFDNKYSSYKSYIQVMFFA